MTAAPSQGELSIERMCALSGVSRASYYRHWEVSAPRQEETGLRDAIQRLALDNKHYGYRRISVQLRREGWPVNHKRVLRIMREDNLLCLRAWPFVPVTTDSRHPWKVVPNLARDMILSGIDQLWVADLTYVRTFAGWVYVAFVIDVFSRFVVGWQVSTSLRTDLALDALEMAMWSHRDHDLDGLVHHSDRGVQYLAIRYSERLAQAGAVASVGSRGDSYDNALAESFNGLYKTELIRRQGPWRGLDDVEFATLEYIDWFNHRRLHSEIGMVPPVEFEQAHYRQTTPATDPVTQ